MCSTIPLRSFSVAWQPFFCCSARRSITYPQPTQYNPQGYLLWNKYLQYQSLCAWYLDFTLSCSTSITFYLLGFVAIESSSFLLYWSSSISSINILVAIHLCGMHSLSSSNTSRCSNRGQLSKAYHQMVPCFVHTVNMFSAKRNLCCLHHEGTQNVWMRPFFGEAE